MSGLRLGKLLTRKTVEFVLPLAFDGGAARAGGKEIPWQSPHTTCYSMVNTEPPEAIMVDGKYRFDKATGQWDHFENSAVNQRDSDMGEQAFEWADGHFRDMFF